MTTPEETEALRVKLRDVMANDGFTQVDVAKTTGLSQSVISRFLRGAFKNPTSDTLRRIKAFLGDEEHTEVLSHEEVRRAVRLYKYVKDTLASGSQIVVRDRDGSEQILIFLW